jgi:DNA replication protein DnaC
VGRLVRLAEVNRHAPEWVRRYLGKSFEIPARPASYVRELTQCVNVVRGFGRAIRRGRTNWLVLEGDNGSGKTHLACHLAAALHIEDDRLRLAWITESDWLTWSYRAARPIGIEDDPEIQEARRQIGQLRKADVIIVDEWLSLTGGYTVVAAQHLCNLFKLTEERPKTLILTTNVPLDVAGSDELVCKDDRSVPVLDGRVVDRLYEYAVRLQMPPAPPEVNHRARARRRREAQVAEWAKGAV